MSALHAFLESTTPLVVVTAVMAAGIALGRLKVRGVGLGVAGVLFAALLAGHLGLVKDVAALAPVRDLGLIMFVYAIGAQVGPGFAQSLKHGGLRLNALAAAVVLLGAGVTVLLSKSLGLDMAAMVGVFAGATTNTPALGAAQQVLSAWPMEDVSRRGLAGLGYAVAYPFGVLGVIGSMLLVRAVFRIHAQAETQALMERKRAATPEVIRAAFEITNQNLDGMEVSQLPALSELGVVVSRIQKGGKGHVEVAHGDSRVATGDIILVVGEAHVVPKAGAILGRPVSVDLGTAPGNVTLDRLVVTHKEVIGKTLGELALDARHDVTVTRIRRGEVEMVARASARFRFGDIIQVVGSAEDVKTVAHLVGNSASALTSTDYLPIFIGLTLGVLLGHLPLPVGDLPAPITLGLAGGPLLAAILLGRLGRVGPVVWYLPGNVNMALRELGICLFLASVGLKAGAHLVPAFTSGHGLTWLACGMAITLIPLLLVAVFARVAWKLDYPSLCGVMAGCMTDPPALVFANALAGADAPAVAYAAVYPGTMVLRIVAAQGLVLLFCA